jgi:N-acetyl-beta-hexosaminidase
MRLSLKDSHALQVWLLAPLLLFPPAAVAENRPVSIVPKPVQLVLGAGSFRLTPNSVITADRDSVSEARFLSRRLSPATGFPFEVTTGTSKGTLAIDMRLDASLTKLGDEGYHLAVGPKGISIRASKTAGLFYAGQSLIQLLPPQIFREAKVSNIEWTIPSVQIEDYPRFKWRGALLDVGRHFMPKEFVKKFIDLLALQKMNSFHWHLTDDQGWRIEIKKYPKLTQIGAWRKETLIGRLEDESQKELRFDGTPHGGFYTQDDAREIVEYARVRHINVVPEIEMPGHAQAAIAAYPELGNTGQQLEVATKWGVFENIFNPKESTILFLQDVLTEVLDIFPSKFVHTGGDEAVKTHASRSWVLRTRKSCRGTSLAAWTSFSPRRGGDSLVGMRSWRADSRPMPLSCPGAEKRGESQQPRRDTMWLWLPPTIPTSTTTKRKTKSPWRLEVIFRWKWFTTMSRFQKTFRRLLPDMYWVRKDNSGPSTYPLLNRWSIWAGLDSQLWPKRPGLRRERRTTRNSLTA